MAANKNENWDTYVQETGSFDRIWRRERTIEIVSFNGFETKLIQKVKGTIIIETPNKLWMKTLDAQNHTSELISANKTKKNK